MPRIQKILADLRLQAYSSAVHTSPQCARCVRPTYSVALTGSNPPAACRSARKHSAVAELYAPKSVHKVLYGVICDGSALILMFVIV